MSEQLFQIGVKGLIRNKDGNILMLHIPEWGHNPAHWDLPGGRMDPDETFLETLKRELEEEIGVTYSGTPKQLIGMLTKITIPVDEVLIPLVFMIYEVKLPNNSKIKLSPDIREEEYKWFTPIEASEVMTIKFSTEFCELVRNL
jgi:8-oxo-dGTP pyrophosphatase MutT (NUDIX family)